MPTTALEMSVRVRPHIERWFFFVASSTASASVSGSGKLRLMYGSSLTAVEPSGPVTAMDVDEGARVTEGGIFMGALPMLDVKPCTGAEELKQRAAWRKDGTGRGSMVNGGRVGRSGLCRKVTFSRDGHETAFRTVTSLEMRFLTRPLRLSHRFTPAFARTMASQQALQKLQSPLKELVLGALPNGATDLGSSEKDKAEVEGWIEKIAQGDINKPDGLKVCENISLSS